MVLFLGSSFTNGQRNGSKNFYNNHFRLVGVGIQCHKIKHHIPLISDFLRVPDAACPACLACPSKLVRAKSEACRKEQVKRVEGRPLR